ncbi:hypothetical protein ACFL53_05460, partial [Pseudomonadota bacterium]
IEYLSATYGEDNVQLFLQDYSRKLLPYFLLNSSAKKAFGKDFQMLWNDFQQYLTTRFDSEITILNQQAVIGRDLDNNPFLQITATGTDGLLVNRNNGEDRAVIAILNAKDLNKDNLNWQEVVNTKGVTAIDQHAHGGLAVSRIVSYADGRQLNDIFLYQNSGWIQLTERQRFRKVRWMPDGSQLLASRKVDGLSELWLLGIQSGAQPTQVWQGEQDVVLGAFDVAPSGDYLVAAVKRPLQGWNLERLDLNERQWQPLTDSRATENSPVFLPDGRIAFSADYDGIYNIYVMEEETRDITQWTREIGGAFEPQWQPGLGLVYQAYGTEGYRLRYIEQPQPLSVFAINRQQGRYDYPPAITENVEKSEPEAYSPWPTVRPHSWFPLIQVDDVSTQAGVITSGSDALGRHNYLLTAAWDFKNDLANVNLIYGYDNRWVLAVESSHNFDTFTQDNSEDYRITRDDFALIQRNYLLTAWEDQLSLHAGVVWDKESLVSQPDFSNIGNYRETHEALTGLALTFDNREAYLNVPGIGWGHYVDLIAETNDLFNADYSGEKYQAQWSGTWDLPGRTTLTARLGLGYADDSAKAFRLGGYDTSEETRLFGRDTQALRGYDESVQRGHQYATQRLELETWLARAERNWSLYPVGLGDISGSLYVDSGAAWDTRKDAKQLTGVGTQITIETKLGYNLTLPVTFGYAKGLDSDKGKNQFFVRIASFF